MKVEISLYPLPLGGEGGRRPGEGAAPRGGVLIRGIADSNP